jgi:GNAT superfamily N-acetyltransferase
MAGQTLEPLDLLLRVATEADARQIAAWGYAPLADTERLLDRDRAYYSIANSAGDVVGCCCFGPEARVAGGDYSAPGLDLAAWLRPDLTGFGRGARFVATVATFARALFGPLTFRVSAPADSQAALRACRRAGFQSIGSFSTAGGGAYVQLALDGSRWG